MRALLGQIKQDLSFAATQVVANPGFSLPCVLALALGIGAVSAIFSVVSFVLLDPLPFREPSRLVLIWETEKHDLSNPVEVSWGSFHEWRDQSKSFDGISLISSVNLEFAMTGRGEPKQIEGSTVLGNYFSLLGTKAAIGRTLTPEDDKPGAPLVAVLSHKLWQEQLGRDPDVLRRGITLAGEPVTVVGVMPPGFDYPDGAQIWLPVLTTSPGVLKDPRLRVFRVIGRLKAGVSLESASSELNTIATRVERTLYPEQRNLGVLFIPFLDSFFGKIRPALYLLLASVGLVLLIACANAANLMLARATLRHREFAVRMALGAGRVRLIQQLLTESLLLAFLAGAVGLGLAGLALSTIVATAPKDVPRISEVHLSPSIVIFTFGVSLLTVLLAGTAPAIVAAKRNLHDGLRETVRASAGKGRVRVREWLVGIEVAMSIILLCGAGLLIRSFRQLQTIDPGFVTSSNVLTFRVTLAKAEYSGQARRKQLYGDLLDRLRALPQVESAAAVLMRPLSGPVGWDNAFTLEGQTEDVQRGNPLVNYEAISPDYFKTMSIAFVSGRDFQRLDTDTAPGVCIVNEALAKRYWPKGDAVGKRLRLGRFQSTAPWLTIVGVVKDVRYREWESPRMDIYVPYMQRAQHRSDFVVKSRVPVEWLIPEIKKQMAALDPDQPISSVASLSDLVGETLARPRFNATLLTLLAALALVLALFGIYSTLMYGVSQRRQEIGIRMAVGSSPADVVRLVLGDGMRVVAAGSVVGIVVALLLARGLSTLLYNLSPFDGGTFGVSMLLLWTVSGLACLIPAFRATRVDPVKALQSE